MLGRGSPSADYFAIHIRGFSGEFSGSTSHFATPDNRNDFRSQKDIIIDHLETVVSLISQDETGRTLEV